MEENKKEVEIPAVSKQATLDDILSAVKELTKTVGDLAKEHAKWRAAGKF